MAIDALGGLFSDLSLAFKQDFDVIACVSYSAAAVRKGPHSPIQGFPLTIKIALMMSPCLCKQLLDTIVIVCALILNPRARKRDHARQAALGGSTMDELGNLDAHNSTPNTDEEQIVPVPLTDAEAQHPVRRTSLGEFSHDVRSIAPETPKKKEEVIQSEVKRL